jgi:hypothetical protein
MKWDLDTSLGQLSYLMKTGTVLDWRSAYSVLMGRPEER